MWRNYCTFRKSLEKLDLLSEYRRTVLRYKSKQLRSGCIPRHICSSVISQTSSKLKHKEKIAAVKPHRFPPNDQISVSSCETVDLDSAAALHFIFISTCRGWWYEYDNVMFDAGFVDSMPGADYSDKIPVVLGIPSTCGSHKELIPFLYTFSKLGYRVVIPNLPGTYLCKPKSKLDDVIYQYSVEEKAEFIKDFLAEIGIERVDLLVTSSCSVYTGIHLCLSQQDMFKSFAMINPTGVKPTKAKTPNVFTTILCHLWEDANHLHFLVRLWLAAWKWSSWKRKMTVSEIVTWARSNFIISYKQVKENAYGLSLQDLPKLAIYTETTRHLDQDSTETLLDIMGIPTSAVTVMEKGEVISAGTPVYGNKGILVKGTALDMDSPEGNKIRMELLNLLKTVRKIS